jgi:hypothetical protein
MRALVGRYGDGVRADSAPGDPTMRIFGSASLGAERPCFRLGSVWLAGCANVLGLGSGRRRLRLPLRC